MTSLKDHSVAVLYKGRRWYSDKTFVCSCGYHAHNLNNREIPIACPQCENTNIVTTEAERPNASRVVKETVFETIRKDHDGFHVKASDVSLKIDPTDNYKMTMKKGNVHEVTYSFRDRSITMTRDGKSVTANEQNLDAVFRGGSELTTLEAISTDQTKAFFEYCFKNFGKEGYERVHKRSRALLRSFNHQILELFSSCGFDYNGLDSIHGERKWRLSTETKPHRVLGIPKYLMKYVKNLNRFGSYQLDNLVELHEAFDGNNMRVVCEIYIEESDLSTLTYMADTLLELFNEYGYRNIKHLVLYLCREVKLEQGIESPSSAATLLRDYARMSKEMDREFEKYPKSLKKVHDIALVNYKMMESEIKKEKFQQVTGEEDYSNLEYKTKQYTIVVPSTPKDLIDEGSSLSHCVASYVNDVINKKCKILFLRNSEDVSQPLVTVEVRGDNVRQVRGQFNRSPKVEEIAFVGAWAKEKGLKVSAYN